MSSEVIIMENQLLFTNSLEFREWLNIYHNSSKGIWIIFSKSDKFISIRPEEALKEALCFGWIDGQINSKDDEKYIKRFTPRRKGSKWSARNRELAAKLIEDGKMTEKGFAAIEQAKADGTWVVPQPEPISDEQISILIEVLKDFEPAYSNFKKMSRSVKSTYTSHYLSAKSDATKKRRLEQIVARLNENKRPM